MWLFDARQGVLSCHMTDFGTGSQDQPVRTMRERRASRRPLGHPMLAHIDVEISPILIVGKPLRPMRSASSESKDSEYMTTIKQDDLIQSIADALQFISYYHPLDYIQAVGRAYEREQSPAAKDALAQILTNSRMCAEGHRPICQDTGIVVVFLKVGMNVRFEGDMGLNDMINEGVRRAYLHPDNKLRASVVDPPIGARKNTRDNTPAVIYTDIVPGDRLEIALAAKGGGSENKSKFTILNPSDSLVDWVVKTLPTMGAGWCPPGMLGIGIGGTAEKAMLLAKESLMAPIDMDELKARGPSNPIEELRLEIFDKVNALGIGAQGLGGLTTVVDVKILDYPTHAASLPVGMIPNCAATRHIEFHLDGSGPAVLTPPKLEDWPDVTWQVSESAIRVDLDTLTPEQVQAWKPGDRLLLNGKLLTGRDAAHKRIQELLESGQGLPARRRFHQPPDLLRRPGRPGARRGRRPRRPHHRHPHGQVHRDDAVTDRPDRHGRQGRARPGRDRVDQEAQGRLPDGRRRRGLPGVAGDPLGQGPRLRGTGHGGDLRIRGGRHAGHGRGRQHGRVGAPDGAGGVAGENRGYRIRGIRHPPNAFAVRRALLVAPYGCGSGDVLPASGLGAMRFACRTLRFGSGDVLPASGLAATRFAYRTLRVWVP